MYFLNTLFSKVQLFFMFFLYLCFILMLYSMLFFLFGDAVVQVAFDASLGRFLKLRGIQLYLAHFLVGSHAVVQVLEVFVHDGVGVVFPVCRGDVIEIVTDKNSHPEADWENYAHTFKARKAIRRYLESVPALPYHRCTRCNPIPGEEVIGIRNHADPDTITIHKRDCSDAITMASSYGDDVVSVDFAADSTLYPVTLRVRAVDRSHLFVDLVDCITNTFRLSMESFNTATERNIVICKIRFGVHSYTELKTIINHISAIDGVDEVHRL